MLLVIGNKNYSSWSLRPWLAMKVLGLAFDEVRIPLYGPGSKEQILRYSPAGRVPILRDGETLVWDSLAILEYLAERHGQLWPADAAERAKARAVSAEMHSGFAALRQHMSMNTRKRYPGKGRTPEALADVARIEAIWSEARGPFLFGGFTAADAVGQAQAPAQDPIVIGFRAVPREARLRMFWRIFGPAWTRAEIDYQLEVLQRAGVGGVMTCCGGGGISGMPCIAIGGGGPCPAPYGPGGVAPYDTSAGTGGGGVPLPSTTSLKASPMVHGPRAPKSAK